ncbi:thyrostimulin beta-5 subunit [Drosophila persimilis]|uniref:Thyrostimulin beta-5 subunit n=1 Tax=Drosophila pseudoobscura pseudoobscura TaxID=46245 RepID=I5AMP4_DROPS|nr:thyrostimulin beta-5 subunit [Drosophila pseudoobscura]XP_026843430.1 thyrostimulin beta-5 subunit [Drosophila persimilis]
MAGCAVLILVLFLGTPLLHVVGTQLVELQPINSGPTVAPLGCHRRVYTYKVTQSDLLGHECWDYVSVWSCWGRCDSSEISDWKFPYKRSFHPVCVHAQRQPAEAILKNCHPEADEGISKYHYMEAVNCHCHTCSTQDTSCEAPANNVLDEGSKAVKVLTLTGADSVDLDY